MATTNAKPIAQKIQPMGLPGRREEIKAPTVGKEPANKRRMMELAAPSAVSSGNGYRKPNTTVSTMSITVRAHNDQTTHAPRGRLYHRLLDPVPLLLLSQHHHSTGKSLPGRYDERFEVRGRANFGEPLKANFGEFFFAGLWPFTPRSKPHRLAFL